MRVAVIGAEGYVGRPLCHRLEAEGHQVQRVDALVYGQTPHYATQKAFTAPEITALMDEGNPEAIIYLAAYAHDPAGRISYDQMMLNNVSRPCQVAQWACGRHIPFIIPSSLSVFSNDGHYPESKRCLEQALAGIKGYHRCVSIMRFGTLYGWEVGTTAQSFRYHLLLNSLMLRAVTEGVIQISSPVVRRPVLSLYYAIAALCDALDNHGPRGDIQNYHEMSATLQQYAETVRSFLSQTDQTETVQIGMGWPSADLRNYGWGEFVPGKLALGALYREIRPRAGDLVIARDTQDFPECLYRFVEKTDGVP